MILKCSKMVLWGKLVENWSFIWVLLLKKCEDFGYMWISGEDSGIDKKYSQFANSWWNDEH